MNENNDNLDLKVAKHLSGTSRQINLLRRTATEVKNFTVQRRILTAALAMLIIVAVLLYIFAVLYRKTGSFTVSVNKFEMAEYGLTLSETRDLKHQTSYLNADIHEHITNIAGSDLPADLDMIDGEHNGDNYIAYTFYLQNAGETTVAYDYELFMENVTNNIDSALRARLYVNGVATTYAKTRTDGTGAEPGTTEFYSESKIARGREDVFRPGDVSKFTIVLWLEGNDPDCIDWLIGGKMRVAMEMKVVHD